VGGDERDVGVVVFVGGVLGLGLGHGHLHGLILGVERGGGKKQESRDNCWQRADMGRSVLRPYIRMAFGRTGRLCLSLTPGGARPACTNGVRVGFTL
jgi:hypothetical protein